MVRTTIVVVSLLAGGMLFVASGYSELGNGTRGNLPLGLAPR
jgi:hypothetical protein